MTTAETIELIVTTVANFYNVKWQDMLKGQYGKGYMRADVYRLVQEILPTSQPGEYLNVPKYTVQFTLRVYPESAAYNILKFQIQSPKRA